MEVNHDDPSTKIVQRFVNSEGGGEILASINGRGVFHRTRTVAIVRIDDTVSVPIPETVGTISVASPHRFEAWEVRVNPPMSILRRHVFVTRDPKTIPAPVWKAFYEWSEEILHGTSPRRDTPTSPSPRTYQGGD